jgi:tetratricopeptide (TPR) repeat protein
LIAGAIVLPIAWLITIFLLVAKYHAHLYAPGDFSQPEHFLATLSSSARASVSTGTLGKPLDFEPFKLSEHASQSDDEEIRHSRIETIITRLDVPELLALHAWHNENDSHSIALQALTLAIAKGRGASKNYSFASASMRKLGRLVEAKGIALLALQLDRDNVDAKYNLALICKMLGSTEEAKLFARDVALNGGEYHRKRIHEEFSDPV